MKKRVATFATNMDFIAAEMEIPADECKAFVVAGCMSEEEDDEIDTFTDKAISIKVVVPGWRSEKVKKKKKYKKIKTHTYKQSSS